MKIQELTLDERIQLAGDIWDSIADEQQSLPLTDAQRRELDARLRTYRVSGEPGVPAAEAIERIRATL